MKTIEIIDNFLSQEDYLIIKNSLTCFNFPWYYSDWVSSQSAKNNNEFYFEHFFFSDFNIQSENFNIIRPILKKLEVKSLIRAKANLYPKLENNLIRNSFHRDQNYSHRGAVYYVNTNDGYTGFEDGTIVESVENRIMIFDSSIPHYSTHCTNQKVRLTININYF
jgi:hypothetical protein